LADTDTHHNILVDTCCGNAKNRPGSPHFHQLNTPYLDRLRAAGVAPEDIDYVLCPHLHVDHRLEYPIARRPLGADVSERQVRLFQRRTGTSGTPPKFAFARGAARRLCRHRAARDRREARSCREHDRPAWRQPSDRDGAGTFARPDYAPTAERPGAGTYTLGYTYKAPWTPLIDLSSHVCYTSTQNRQTSVAPDAAGVYSALGVLPGDPLEDKINSYGFDLHNTARFTTGVFGHALTVGGDCPLGRVSADIEGRENQERLYRLLGQTQRQMSTAVYCVVSEGARRSCHRRRSQARYGGLNRQATPPPPSTLRLRSRG
jgi:Metallo-beta-lactamase superfamily